MRSESGDVLLVTRSRRSHGQWTESLDVRHVCLTERLVSVVARDIDGSRDCRNGTARRRQGARPDHRALTTAIAQDAGPQGLGGTIYVEALGTQLAGHLLRYYAKFRLRERSVRGRLSLAMARRTAAYFDGQLAEPLTRESLAVVAGLGVWSFGRQVRASINCAPHADVIARRVACAEQLLRQGELPRMVIVAVDGYADIDVMP
ncbi:helix-turn-helix transcriptional regulator [Methylibium sp. Root1272]|uniref:helix-turn-helix transcriptional regulator n=1 Tax=Methylibium sp. Root1272 TaxID=1736441 RepID=UPI0006FFF85F|nr:helix-turn-helix transcriptional regulator [Methylibium sp. Root1272]KQW69880.1 hypothetical protein ASC67_05175 [Methylibium sp. Root1272]